MKSLGDSEGTVLIHAELKLCYINNITKAFGILTKVLPVHLEFIDKLLTHEGAQVAKLTEVKGGVFTLTYQEALGKPQPLGCEGEKEHFAVSINEGAAKESGWDGTDESRTKKPRPSMPDWWAAYGGPPARCAAVGPTF